MNAPKQWAAAVSVFCTKGRRYLSGAAGCRHYCSNIIMKSKDLTSLRGRTCLLAIAVAFTAATLRSEAQSATIQTFTNKAEFFTITHATNCTGELPQLGRVGDANASFTSGRVTFRVAPPSSGLWSGGAGGNDWTPLLPGADIAIDDRENLDAEFDAPVYSAGFDFVEPLSAQTDIESTFAVTLKNGATPISYFSFNAANNVAAFVGVHSSTPFTKLEIREDAGGAEDEFFGQFYCGGLPRCALPPSGIVAWWPGDDNANDYIDSNHGAMQNGAAFTGGKIGPAFSFDGNNDVCRIPNSPALQPASITVEGWIKGTSPGNYRYALSKHFTGANPSYALYTGGDGALYFFVTVGANNAVLSPSGGVGFWDGAWHHVAGTYDGGYVRLYIDGVRMGNGIAATGAIQYTNSPANELFIGNLEPSASPYALRADIDELAIFDRALSSNEIAAIYAAGSAGMCKPVCLPPPPGLVLWWDFADETATDRSGFQNNGTVYGTPVFANGTVRFDNPPGDQQANQWIALPYSASISALETNSFTIAIRYKSTDTSQQNGRLFGKYSGGVVLDYNSGGIACAYSRVGDGVRDMVLPPSIYTDCSESAQTTDGAYHWQVVSLDRANGLATQQIDIGHAGSASFTNLGRVDLDGLVLGATRPSDTYAARQTTVDEVVIFNRALSGNEIAAIYAAGSAGMCKPQCVPSPLGLVSWWPFDGTGADVQGVNPAILMNNPTYAAGRVSQGLNFNGIDQSVKINAAPSLNVGAGSGLTVETWIYPAEVNTSHALVEWNNGAGSFGVHFYVGVVAGGLYANLPPGGQITQLFSPSGLISSNEWHHVALSYDKLTGIGALFLDGLVVTQKNLGSFTPQTSYDLYLGKRPLGGSDGPYWYHGIMDEVAIYNRALTSNEIAAIYAADSAGKCKKDVLLIDFNAGVDSFGNSAGELVFNGPNGFQVRFTDDESSGSDGGNANGVHISNLNYGNIRVGTSNLVLGAQNDFLSGGTINRHSSGIVGNFSQGAQRVSFFDTDDDTTQKSLFAFDALGNLIGQTAPGSRQTFSIDSSMTGGRLIYSIEFDTQPGTAGGSFDGTYFTIDDFQVEYFANCPGGCLQSDLLIAMTAAPLLASAGSNVTFAITLTNQGPDAASGVTLTNVLPAGVTFVSAAPTQGGCTNNFGVVTCNVGSLTNRAFAAVNIVVAATVAGTITNTVTVVGVESDPNPTNNSASVQVTVTPADQNVLFVNVNGSYNADGNNFYQTLGMAGARATFVNLSANGQAAALIQTNQFEQIWVFDLSSGSDNYPADWQAIGDWFNARSNKTIICDGRIISSYWSGRWQNEGRRLTQNYYENMKGSGGGLMLGTDHNEFHSGINSINQRININPFVGNFNLSFIPVDTASPLMIFPNNMGSQLFDDSSPGQTPFGLQPNGIILYSVAWHSGNTNTPGISSTIRGGVGFRIQIAAPANGSQFNEEAPITLQVQQAGGTPPFSYSWSSDRDGMLGAGSTLQISTLSTGLHRITVLGTDGGGGADTASVQITILPVAPTVTVDLQAASDTGVSSTDELTSVTAPTFDVTVNKRGRIEFDFTGDGMADAVRTNVSAGAHTFAASGFADASHTVNARFVPLFGIVTQASLTITVDTFGPRGLSAIPTGDSSNRIDFLEVTFDSQLDGSTFTPTDVSITGSFNPTISGIQLVSGNIWRVNFASPLPADDYSIAIGPDVRDLAGNPMNQDRDVTNGETADDILITQLTVTLPDLAVTDILAPTNALMGSPLTVTWAITNMGSATANGLWQDTILLANNPDGTNAQPLSSFIQSSPLPPVESLTRTGTVILPLGMFGDRYVVVRTDSGDQLFEGDGETNNVKVRTNKLHIQAADLAVESVTVAPSMAQFGTNVQVTWLVRNVGDGAATANWSDRLYLSTSSNSLVGAMPLLTVNPATTSLPLAAGASYSRTQEVIVALNPLVPPGNYFIVVIADSDRAQPESSETNNAASRPIELVLPPLPDLAVSSLLAPTNGQAGQQVVLMWTVTNQGPAAVTNVWSEAVSVSNVLSGLQTLDVFTFTNGLASQGSVTRTQTVTVPVTGPAGDVWFIVETDSRHEVFEADELNNMTAATNSTAVPLELKLSVPLTQISEDAANPVIRAHGDAQRCSRPTAHSHSHKQRSHGIERATEHSDWSRLFGGPVRHSGIARRRGGRIASCDHRGFGGWISEQRSSDHGAERGFATPDVDTNHERDRRRKRRSRHLDSRRGDEQFFARLPAQFCGWTVDCARLSRHSWRLERDHVRRPRCGRQPS